MSDGLAMASADHAMAKAPPGDPQTQRFDGLSVRAQSIACLCAGVGVLTGYAALIGHALLIPVLHNWRHDLGTVVPNTALVMIALGLAVMMQVGSGFTGRMHKAGIGLSIFCLCMMIAAMVEHLFNWTIWLGETKFDDMLFGRDLPLTPGHVNFRTGFGAAMTFGLMSISVAVLGTRSTVWLYISTLCTVTAMTLSLIFVMGHGFAVSDASIFWAKLDMSLQATIGSMGVLVSAVLARPDRPAARTILSHLAGGVTARRLLPVCVCAPVVLAILYSLGKEFALIEYSSGTAIMTAMVIVMMTLMVLVSSSALNRSDRHRRAAEARQTRLMNELDHRVKNNLAAVLALFDQTVAHSRDIDALQSGFRERLVALARAHEALAESHWCSVSIGTMIDTVVAPFAGPGGRRLLRSGPTTELPANAVLPLAVTLSELATNATKYGAFNHSASLGQVELKWETVNSMLMLEWVERGGPVPQRGADGATAEPPVTRGIGRRGFGVTLIEGMIAHELGGRAEVRFEAGGLRCSIRVPLSPDPDDTRTDSRGLDVSALRR